ncbi:MAG: hypothetical protein ACE37F_31525 [Nannocystaceae bacterium]|nr:hypothetical protein [bacterium]
MLDRLKSKRTALVLFTAAAALAAPAMAVAAGGTTERIERIGDRGSSTLGFVQMESWNGYASELYYFGAHGTCASIAAAELSEDQIDRLLQAQIHGLEVTPQYQIGAWGGYKCLTGFDITTPL